MMIWAGEVTERRVPRGVIRVLLSGRMEDCKVSFQEEGREASRLYPRLDILAVPIISYNTLDLPLLYLDLYISPPTRAISKSTATYQSAYADPVRRLLLLFLGYDNQLQHWLANCLFW